MIYQKVIKKLFSTESAFQYLYGLNPIQIAIRKKKRTFDTLFVSDSSTLELGSKLKMIINQAQLMGIPIKFQHKDKLTRMVSNQPHQNIVLKCSQLIAKPAQEPHKYASGLYIYCDKITDPQNFGSIIRSSVFFGVEALFIPKKNSCPLNSTVSKTSAGALQLLRIDSINKEQLFLEQWREDGGIVVSTDVDHNRASLSLANIHNQINFKDKKMMIIMGSEGSGVSPHIYKHSDFSLAIPRKGKISQLQLLVDSLNVSSALTCILYELSKNK